MQPKDTLRRKIVIGWLKSRLKRSLGKLGQNLVPSKQSQPAPARNSPATN